MLDAEGAVIESWPLPPVIPRVTERARLRAIDSGRAAKEYAARRAAEAPDPAPTSPQEPV
jgi:hypothetical protein